MIATHGPGTWLLMAALAAAPQLKARASSSANTASEPVFAGRPISGGQGAPTLPQGILELRPWRRLASLAPDVKLREPGAFARDRAGIWYVFDRRLHSVFALNPDLTFRGRLVTIGGEPGLLLPSFFCLSPDGSFAIADAPSTAARIQVFGPDGRCISASRSRPVQAPASWSARSRSPASPACRSTAGRSSWVALSTGYIYVYGPTGEKIRASRLRDEDGWPVQPTSLFVTAEGQLLVTEPCRVYCLPF